MGRLVLVVMVLCLGGTATAEPAKPEGVRLFEEGRALASQGKYEQACAKFQASFALDRAPGTLLNLGDCLENLGQLRKAWLMFDTARRDFERDADARSAYARKRAEAVDRRLATVVMKVADPELAGLVITIGNRSVPPAPEIIERAEPGEVEITASAPGRRPFTSSARGVAGARVIVELPALPALGETGDAAVGRSREQGGAPEGRRDGGRVRLAGIVTGAGGVVLIGSVALGLSARSTYNDADCTDTPDGLVCSEDGARAVDSAGARADIATGLAIAGGLGVVGGVVLYLTAPREQLTVAPTMSAGSVGLAVRGRF